MKRELEDDKNDYAPPHPASASVAASFDLEPEILFGFGVQEAVVTAVGCTYLLFAVLAQGCLLVLLG